VPRRSTTESFRDWSLVIALSRPSTSNCGAINSDSTNYVLCCILGPIPQICFDDKTTVLYLVAVWISAIMVLSTYISRYTRKSGTSEEKTAPILQAKLGWHPGEREGQEERTDWRGTDIRERREERELGLRQEEKDREERGTENKQNGKRGSLACHKRKEKGLGQEERKMKRRAIL
jgi:hypothetical protein